MHVVRLMIDEETVDDIVGPFPDYYSADRFGEAAASVSLRVFYYVVDEVVSPEEFKP